MTRKLIIHIGHYKTGTTALQSFFAQNRRLLARSGVNYAETRTNHSKHSAFAFSLLRPAGADTLMHGYKNDTPPEEFWGELAQEVRTADQETTLISSEEFMRLAEFPEAAQRLRSIVSGFGDIEVRILVWLRAPGAHLDSWYNQLVKMRQTLPHYEPALTGHVEAIHYDYAHALAPWSEIFGPESVDIRAYPRDKTRLNVLVEDALDALGVPHPDQISYAVDHNQRLDERLLEAVRLLQNAGFPRHTLDNARDQMRDFLLREDALADEAESDRAGLEARARAGLEGLAERGRLSFDPAGMPVDIPPRPAPSPEMLVASFALTELVTLRRRMNSAKLGRLDDLSERVAALEQLVSKGAS